MKNLVILQTSTLRGNEDTWRTIYKHLLDPLQADLALCVFGSFDKNSSLYKRAKHIYHLDNYVNWDDYYTVNCPEQVNNILNFFNNININAFPRAAFFNFTHKHCIKNNFKSVALNYDRIILSRSDYFFINDHPLLDNDFVYIPNGEDWGGVCDRQCVFPSYLWDTVLDIINFIATSINLELKPGQYGINSEYVHKLFLEKNSINYKRYPSCQFITHVNKCNLPLNYEKMNQSLNTHTLSNNKDVYIKYITEYNNAINNLPLNLKNKFSEFISKV